MAISEVQTRCAILSAENDVLREACVRCGFDVEAVQGESMGLSQRVFANEKVHSAIPQQGNDGEEVPQQDRCELDRANTLCSGLERANTLGFSRLRDGWAISDSDLATLAFRAGGEPSQQ